MPISWLTAATHHDHQQASSQDDVRGVLLDRECYGLPGGETRSWWRTDCTTKMIVCRQISQTANPICWWLARAATPRQSAIILTGRRESRSPGQGMLWPSRRRNAILVAYRRHNNNLDAIPSWSCWAASSWRGSVERNPRGNPWDSRHPTGSRFHPRQRNPKSRRNP